MSKAFAPSKIREKLSVLFEFDENTTLYFHLQKKNKIK